MWGRLIDLSECRRFIKYSRVISCVVDHPYKLNSLMPSANDAANVMGIFHPRRMLIVVEP